MDKVVITKSKVDSLADKIRAKAGTSGNMTIDQMGDVVEGIYSYTDGRIIPNIISYYNFTIQEV